MDDALAIDQQQMLAPCAQIERQTHRRDASGAGTETYDARVLDPLALQFQRIEQARAQHSSGAVWVVVEHRNVSALDTRSTSGNASLRGTACQSGYAWRGAVV